MPPSATLTPTQRYAASALLALALNQAQIHQTLPLGSAASFPDRTSTSSSSSASSSSSTSSSDGASHLWINESRGLLRPVFRWLEIDEKAWPALEETAASDTAKHHIGAFLRVISEEDNELSLERSDQMLALSKAVDAMVMSWEASTSDRPTKKGHREYEEELDERSNSSAITMSTEVSLKPTETGEQSSSGALLSSEESLHQFNTNSDVPNQSPVVFSEETMFKDNFVNNQQKVAVLYELLCACLADTPQDNKKASRQRKGYDSRHRVALRLLATWLDIKWIKMEALEVMVACSAMAAAKEEAESQEHKSAKSKWSKWKRGGIIGAAALTGGALLAITGGLAAPAIAAGFGALAPTLGTLVPFIGASGFAAMAGAAGSVAGSVAVAASFGAAGAGLSGSKMARRIGGVEEFEFKPLGLNHNQGRLAVGILVSGFVFTEEDFIRPWEGYEDNLERYERSLVNVLYYDALARYNTGCIVNLQTGSCIRYALQWESKYLIVVSTAIQDWITSRLTTELMRTGAMMTVLGTLVTALAWPAALLAATDFIDSKWSMAIDRADKAGKLLAEVLLKGLQGNRPVTLIGFSLGGRVIFKCLEHLAESGDNNDGLVERVVLLGAPISLKGEQWENARKMVAGRFINVYSGNDWILGVTFRASLLTQGLAGIQAVDVPGIENVDVTDLIDGHSSYLWAVQQILAQLELDTYYPVFSSANPPSLEKLKLEG